MEIVFTIVESPFEKFKEWLKIGLLCLIPVSMIGFIIYRLANIPDAPPPAQEDKEGAMGAWLYQNTVNQMSQYHGYPSF